MTSHGPAIKGQPLAHVPYSGKTDFDEGPQDHSGKDPISKLPEYRRVQDGHPLTLLSDPFQRFGLDRPGFPGANPNAFAAIDAAVGHHPGFPPPDADGFRRAYPETMGTAHTAVFLQREENPAGPAGVLTDPSLDFHSD
jgi:hypothetical protein